MPYEFDRPVGAWGGGTGRKRWVEPRVTRPGVGVWAGQPEGGTPNMGPAPAIQPNREVSRETVQPSNWNQAAVDRTGDQTAGFSPFAGPDSPQERVRGRLIETKNAAAWTGDQARKTQDNLEMRQAENMRLQQSLKNPAPVDPAINQFFTTHKDHLEDVIKNSGLDPQAAAHLRENFARKNPEIMQVYGPAFETAATQKKAGSPWLPNVTPTSMAKAVAAPTAWMGDAVRKSVMPWVNRATDAFGGATNPSPPPASTPVPASPPPSAANPWSGVGPAADYVFGSGKRPGAM